jgi:hypothetical protein
MTAKSEPASGHPVGRVYERTGGAKSTKAVTNMIILRHLWRIHVFKTKPTGRAGASSADTWPAQAYSVSSDRRQGG